MTTLGNDAKPERDIAFVFRDTWWGSNPPERHELEQYVKMAPEREGIEDYYNIKDPTTDFTPKMSVCVWILKSTNCCGGTVSDYFKEFSRWRLRTPQTSLLKLQGPYCPHESRKLPVPFRRGFPHVVAMHKELDFSLVPSAASPQIQGCAFAHYYDGDAAPKSIAPTHPVGYILGVAKWIINSYSPYPTDNHTPDHATDEHDVTVAVDENMAVDAPTAYRHLKELMRDRHFGRVKEPYTETIWSIPVIFRPMNLRDESQRLDAIRSRCVFLVTDRLRGTIIKEVNEELSRSNAPLGALGRIFRRRSLGRDGPPRRVVCVSSCEQQVRVDDGHFEVPDNCFAVWDAVWEAVFMLAVRPNPIGPNRKGQLKEGS